MNMRSAQFFQTLKFVWVFLYGVHWMSSNRNEMWVTSVAVNEICLNFCQDCQRTTTESKNGSNSFSYFLCDLYPFGCIVLFFDFLCYNKIKLSWNNHVFHFIASLEFCLFTFSLSSQFFRVELLPWNPCQFVYTYYLYRTVRISFFMRIFYVIKTINWVFVLHKDCIGCTQFEFNVIRPQQFYFSIIGKEKRSKIKNKKIITLVLR